MSDDGLRAALEVVVNEVLAPLLRADGSDIMLVSCDEESRTAVIGLGGDAKVGPGAVYVQEEIVTPALRRGVEGRGVEGPLTLRFTLL